MAQISRGIIAKVHHTCLYFVKHSPGDYELIAGSEKKLGVDRAADPIAFQNSPSQMFKLSVRGWLGI